MTTVIQWDAQNDVAIRKFRETDVDVPCLIPWRFLFIQEHTKKVFGCPYHTRPYGDLTTHSLDEIWNGANAQEMRGSLLKHDIQKFCLNNAAACPLIFDAMASGKFTIEDHIEMGENDHWCLGPGWFRPEKFPDVARWTGPRADFQIKIAGKRAIRLEVVTARPNVQEEPTVGSVLVDDQPIGSFVLADHAWHTLLFSLPAKPNQETGRVSIITQNPFVPAELLNNGDTRSLGIVVRRIQTSRLTPGLLEFGETPFGGRMLRLAAKLESFLSGGGNWFRKIPALLRVLRPSSPS
jgi:hypothetical protein